jgi:tetratricopeptide (TPR) repeat protein
MEATMKKRFALMLLAVAVVGLWAGVALAQMFGKVSGVCKDETGKPLVGAIVRFLNTDTGQKFDLKTNAKGEYMSIGIPPGHAYTLSLLRDGKDIFHLNKITVNLGDNDPMNLDVAAEQQQSLKQQGYTEEQAKEMQKKALEHNAAVAKETDTIKVLNEKITAAKAASDSGDYETAIATLTEATQLDATRDLLWFKLGEAYTQSLAKQTDAGEKTKRLDAAAADLTKAIDLKKQELASDTKPDPLKTATANKNLAAYYNSLGNVYGRQGNTDAAVQAYGQSAQLDPTSGGMYYFNLGAVLTNANKTSDAKMAHAAADAFDKAIAADPNKADAYYWKASNLLSLATLGKDNKMIVPDGTVDAYQKYLELKPDGPHAEEVKATLQGLGATVETTFGKKKAAAKK